MPEIRQWHASNVAPACHLFSAKCGANLLCGALLARFVLIMGINAQRHIDRSVSCEILNLLDIQPALKQSCDVGMPELVRMNRTTLECGAVAQRTAGSSTVRFSIIWSRHLSLLLENGFRWQITACTKKKIMYNKLRKLKRGWINYKSLRCCLRFPLCRSEPFLCTQIKNSQLRFWRTYTNIKDQRTLKRQPEL